MSSTQNLQNFIKSIRSPYTDPHDLPEEDKKLSDEEMREANVKHVEEKRSQGKSTLTPRQKEMAEEIDTESAKEIPLMEKDGGGGGGAGGAGGAGGLAGGGTVAVASDPGVCPATYGGDSKRRLGMKPSKKKKKKKDKYRTSGVTKVDRFLRGEPVNQKKSVQEFAQWVVQEARVEMLQLDAKPENVNTNDVNEPPLVASKKSGKVRNPQGRRGNFGMAPGQQGYTRSQYSSHFNKMETITKVLQSQPSVLNLLKALDTDVPMGVN